MVCVYVTLFCDHWAKKRALKAGVKVCLICLFPFLIWGHMLSGSLYGAAPPLTVGKSVKGVPLKLYRFGTGENLIILIANIHGKEKNTSRTAFSLIRMIRRNQLTVPKTHSLWIAPQMNPDGYRINVRTNIRFVDLNRNFPSPERKKVSTFYGYKLSNGDHPFSEPETRAVRKIFELYCRNPHSAAVLLSLHSRGRMIIPANDSLPNLTFAREFARAVRYPVRRLPYYSAGGSLTEWATKRFGMPCLTIELTTHHRPEPKRLARGLRFLFQKKFKDRYYSYGNTSIIIPNLYERQAVAMMPTKSRPRILQRQTDWEKYRTTLRQLMGRLLPWTIAIGRVKNGSTAIKQSVYDFKRLQRLITRQKLGVRLTPLSNGVSWTVKTSGGTFYDRAIAFRRLVSLAPRFGFVPLRAAAKISMVYVGPAAAPFIMRYFDGSLKRANAWLRRWHRAVWTCVKDD